MGIEWHLVKYQCSDTQPSKIEVVCHGDGLLFGNISHSAIARTLLGFLSCFTHRLSLHPTNPRPVVPFVLTATLAAPRPTAYLRVISVYVNLVVHWLNAHLILGRYQLGLHHPTLSSWYHRRPRGIPGGLVWYQKLNRRINGFLDKGP